MHKKPFTKMTAKELAQATREFDGPAEFKPVKPSAAELAKHRRANKKAGRGRPQLGSGAVRVLFTLDPDLLVRMDAFAQRYGLKRSNLITASVEAFLRRQSTLPSGQKGRRSTAA